MSTTYAVPPTRVVKRGTIIPELAGEDAIGYVRVSDVNGRSGPSFGSPETQELDIRQKAAELGLNLRRVIHELDESGRTFERPKWNEQVRESVLSGRTPFVIVPRVDRYGRNTIAGLEQFDEIVELGGLLIAGDVPVYPGMRKSHYRDAIVRKLVDAEAASDRIQENWEAAVIRAMQRGTYPGHTAPTGYRFKRPFTTGPGPDEQKDKSLVPGPAKEWKATRAIFTGRAAGKPWTELAAAFSKATGIALHPQTLKNLVKNRAYVGELKWGEGFDPIKGAHKALVTEAEWQAAQTKHARAGRPGRGKGKGQALLQGVLYCGSCGKPMSYRGGAGMDYTCPRSWSGGECPAPVLIKASRIEAYVEEHLLPRLAELVLEGPTNQPAQVKATQAELDELDWDHEQWQESIRGKRFPAEKRAPIVDAYLAKREELEEELAELQAESAVEPISAEAVAMWQAGELDLTEKRALLRATVKSITVQRLTPGRSTSSPLDEERVQIVTRERGEVAKLAGGRVGA